MVIDCNALYSATDKLNQYIYLNGQKTTISIVADKYLFAIYKNNNENENPQILIASNKELERQYRNSSKTAKIIGCIYKENNSGLEFGITNEIILSLNNKSENIENLISKYCLTLEMKNSIYEKYLIPQSLDVIEVSNKLYETNLFKYVLPNIYVKNETHFAIPNDEFFSKQIALHNIGQSTIDGHCGLVGADINILNAWDITLGSEDIVIAVIDRGVSINHPDLPTSRQVRIIGSNFGSGNQNNPEPIDDMDSHGNACAGVIAATINNNEGIVGVAPYCKIMPIRLEDTNSYSDYASAIILAVDSGAKIISFSEGWSNGTNNLIVEAIQYALVHNVCFVTSIGNNADHTNNENGSVSFPANINLNGLISVGASDRYDRQSLYSPSSNLVDIVAPSSRAKNSQDSNEHPEMWTLDMPDYDGYNPIPSDYSLIDHSLIINSTYPSSGTNYLCYTARFGGTSHACPLVAGVAALMLSVNPSLTPSEIENIIKTTADKVGGYDYVNGRCNEMGYGRLNAYAAVKEAQKRYIQNHLYTNGTTVIESGTDIYAGYSVTDAKPYGNVVIDIGSNVTFNATNKIILKHGFIAKYGSNFHAYISENPNTINQIRKRPTDHDVNADGINMDIKENQIENTSAYIIPNPSNSIIRIINTENINDISIYNLSGNKLIQTTEPTIDISNLSKGLYIVRITTSNGQIRQDKLIHN